MILCFFYCCLLLTSVLIQFSDGERRKNLCVCVYETFLSFLPPRSPSFYIERRFSNYQGKRSWRLLPERDANSCEAALQTDKEGSTPVGGKTERILFFFFFSQHERGSFISFSLSSEAHEFCVSFASPLLFFGHLLLLVLPFSWWKRGAL